ncbi:MAG: hypothetical protein KIS76_10865 [Pyrinomonadaceae bacterium]|nr:hypothetical protein [Pyrinomonadaceae bacterium]
MKSKNEAHESRFGVPIIIAILLLLGITANFPVLSSQKDGAKTAIIRTEK